MAETADPTEDASSSITDPVPAQSENPNLSPEPPTNPNPHPEPPTNPNLYPEPPTNPNPNPPPIAIAPPPFPPSFRPLGPPIMPPQYGSVTVSAPPVRYLPPPHYPYGHVVSNGYMTVPPPGMPHYQGPYPTMVRPGFPPRPILPIGVISQIPRPPIPGAPFVPPTVRPAVPAVVAIEKPQTTVYVGKIASSVENDFLLSLLRLCGPVKSWKRAQDPSNGTPKGFGFCEFEAAEGILRALRLLTKLNIDGQELVLNINKTTREYLDRYVEKKTEREKLKEIENQTLEKENESEPDAEKHEFPKTTTDESAKTPESEGEDHEYKIFGIVSDEDRGVDKDSLEKIASMIKERLKKNPLPPPPPPPPIQTTVSTKSNSERPSKSRDVDSDIGISRNVEGKNEDEITSGTDSTTAKEKAETSSPNKALKNERDRERDKEKDREREKERELERAERERDRERVRREKDRESKIREVERLYNNRLKDWEAREREQEHRRLKEKEREKEKQKERRREISKDEDGSDDEDDTRKRRRRRNTLEEKRRKREREKEEDLIDRIKEEEEIAEAKKRAIEEEEEEKRVKEMELLNNNNHINEESENVPIQVDDHMIVEGKEMDVDFAADGDNGDVINSNEMEEEMTDTMKHNNDAPTKKLGFGLVASGKKTTVPSVFHQEDDENIEDKKMRPLVPIDYSTEELQAVQTTPHSSTQPNLLAAAEFAKRISGVSNSKEKKPEVERDRNGRSTDRGRHRDREYNDSKDKGHERSYDREREDKPKAENKKLLDAKQLIDMIPKTKEELFSYEINWAVYDKHELHEKMRPWISKKITEFLGEEEETLVEYIVNSTKDHVQASKMLELLQSILDDEAEMFVLKMWRMLIFEIKRVETGLSAQPKP